jgi:hypothetical protein
MNLCLTCWNAGRSLWEGSCMCGGEAMKPTEFHTWSASNRKDNFAKREPERKIEAPVKTKLVFGKRPEEKKKRR